MSSESLLGQQYCASGRRRRVTICAKALLVKRTAILPYAWLVDQDCFILEQFWKHGYDKPAQPRSPRHPAPEMELDLLMASIAKGDAWKDGRISALYIRDATSGRSG